MCPALCDPVDCSPPGSCVRGILQARILEWVACPSPGDLPNPGIEPASPATPALQAGSLPLSHRGSLGTVHDPPNNWDQQTGSSTNHTGCETPLRRGKGGQTRGAMQQGQRLPSAQKRSGSGTGWCVLGWLKWRLLCFTETVGLCQVNPAHLFFSKMGDVGRHF